MDIARRRIKLTEAGKLTLDARFGSGRDRWASPIYREEVVTQALSALFAFDLGRDYVLRDGKVQIVDEYTGRIMADRTWSAGLHQLIEAKEGVELTKPRLTLGRMTYQSLFRRYLKLAGMTGTAAEVAGELWAVYGVRCARIPTHRPSRRRLGPPVVMTRMATKLEAVTERVSALHEAGAPVLVGTRTVAASEALAERLRDRGLDFALLNAVQDADEAAIIGQAGQCGRITIATNMAGRGTDIRLAPDALEAGGLQVVMTERHEAARIDRQLAGRCARQGDPGAFQVYLSLEDDLLLPSRLSPPLRVARAIAFRLPLLRAWVVGRAQRRMERAHARMRRQLFASEGQLDQVLAFSGMRE